MALPQPLQTARKAFLQIGAGKLFKGLVTLLVILGIGWLVKSLDFEGVAKWINFTDGEGGEWYQGAFGYYLVGVIFTGLGGPRQVISFFAAYFFGLWEGIAIAMAAVVTSCFLDAVFARIFETSIRRQIKGKVDIAFDFWRTHPFSTTIIIRLLPVGSNFLTNLAAGATGVPLIAFVAASALGYIPQMAVFALMGTGVDVGQGWQVILGIILFVLLTVLGLWVYGRYRKLIRAKQKEA